MARHMFLIVCVIAATLIDFGASLDLQPSTFSFDSTNQSISTRRLYQTRFHYGANIGSWFVLEKWLSGSMYIDGSAGTSEYDAVKAYVDQFGISKARYNWENYWSNWMSDDLWNFLLQAGANGVRIPMGWFTMGPDYVANTVFEPYGEVYRNAWQFYLNAIKTAQSKGIAVLIDMHALPGGANKGDHSGAPASMEGNFFGNKQNEDLAVKIAKKIVQDVQQYDNVLGIAIVNEADTGSDYDYYYSTAVKAIREVDGEIPIYVSDAWNYDEGQKLVDAAKGVVLDTHVYRCFGDDVGKNPDDLINSISLPQDTRVIVGEFSTCMSDESWSQIDPNKKQEYENRYGQKEYRTFRDNASGMFFWTLKMEWMDGGEWGFKQMIEQGAMPTISHDNSQMPTDQQEVDARNDALQKHIDYWNEHAPGEQMEHWRFGTGYDIGWADAKQYWKFSGSVMGQKDLLMNARLDIYVKEQDAYNSKYLWEFQQGGIHGGRQRISGDC